jgi:hypothetical protein
MKTKHIDSKIFQDQGLFSQPVPLNSSSMLSTQFIARVAGDQIAPECMSSVQGLFELASNCVNYWHGHRDSHTYAGMARGAFNLGLGLTLFGINVSILNQQSTDKTTPLLFYCKSSLAMIYQASNLIFASSYATNAALSIGNYISMRTSS